MLGCYYDNDVCPIKEFTWSASEEYFDVAGKVEGKSSTDMKKIRRLMWGGSLVKMMQPWKMDTGVNGGYPYLYWEKVKIRV